MQDNVRDNASVIEELETAITAGTPDKRLNALTRITDLFIAGTGHHSQRRHRAVRRCVLSTLITYHRE